MADETNMSSYESDENTDSEDNATEVSDAETQDISILISEPDIPCGQDK